MLQKDCIFEFLMNVFISATLRSLQMLVCDREYTVIHFLLFTVKKVTVINCPTHFVFHTPKYLISLEPIHVFLFSSQPLPHLPKP